MSSPSCHHCDVEMKRIPDHDLLELLTSSLPGFVGKLAGGSGRSKVKGFECPTCGLIELYRKKGGEP